MRSPGRTSFNPNALGDTFAIVPVGVRTELGVEVRCLIEQAFGDPPGKRLFRIVVTSQVPVADRMRARRQRLFRDGDELERCRRQTAGLESGAKSWRQRLPGRPMAFAVFECWMWFVHGTFNVRPWTRGGSNLRRRPVFDAARPTLSRHCLCGDQLPDAGDDLPGDATGLLDVRVSGQDELVDAELPVAG